MHYFIFNRKMLLLSVVVALIIPTSFTSLSSRFMVETSSGDDEFNYIMGLARKYVSIERKEDKLNSPCYCFPSEFNDFIKITGGAIETTGPLQSTSDQLNRCVQSIKPLVHETAQLNSLALKHSMGFLEMPKTHLEFVSRANTMCSRSFSQLLLYYEAIKERNAFNNKNSNVMNQLLPYYCLLTSVALLTLPDTESGYSSHYSYYLLDKESPNSRVLHSDSDSSNVISNIEQYIDRNKMTPISQSMLTFDWIQAAFSTISEKLVTVTANGVPLLKFVFFGTPLYREWQYQAKKDILGLVNTIERINKMAINSMVLSILQWSSRALSFFVGFGAIIFLAIFMIVSPVTSINTDTIRNTKENTIKGDNELDIDHFSPCSNSSNEESNNGAATVTVITKKEFRQRNAHEPEDKVDIETGTVDAFRYNHTTNQRFRDADLLWERM